MNGKTTPMEYAGADKKDDCGNLNNFINERSNAVIEMAKKVAEETARTEMKLMEFEMLCATLFSEKDIRNAQQWVGSYRETEWKRALKAAKGDEDKAYLIYNGASI